jgi:hypothetical protein
VTFVQGPEFFLNQLEITVPCVVDPKLPARLDPEHRVFLNWETYYLSDDSALAAFRADPALFSGPVTNPVTRERFQPTARSIRLEHGGRIFLFPDDAAAATFASMPDSFVTPKVPMMMKPKMEPAEEPTEPGMPAEPQPSGG